ncbi:MAG: hypothetical protein QG594_96 [Bacteroidota bacterium]|jgi:hypothetical protein|nr:hypothetical protein [Bacteroidota bacterium]
MKKCIVILFLASYLFSTTQLCELLKINRLVEHYIEHTHKDKNLSLLAFLCMHYIHTQVKDGDFEKDMKLPFKTLDTCNYASINFCTPIEEFDFAKKLILKRYKTPLYRYHFSFSSNFSSSIWQPPKSC